MTAMRAAFFGLVVAATLPAAASAETQPWLMLGDCTLVRDPASSEARGDHSFLVCLRGKAGAESTTISGAPQENYWVRHASGTLGVHVTRYVALLAKGRLRDVIPLGQKEIIANETRATDYAVVQLGNPALHRVWVSAGRQRLPFGLDLSHAIESYKSFETRAFWASPEQTATLSLDDLRFVRFDFGYGSNEIVKTEERMHAVHAASARLMFDLSALDGSRLVASGYGENRGARRFGLGFVTVSRKGDETSFEFVRQLETPDGRTAPFRQLLRLAYLGSWRNESRWVVQVDDERQRVRMGLLGYDVRLFRHGVFRFAVSHYKSEAGDDYRRWLVTSGLEAQL